MKKRIFILSLCVLLLLSACKEAAITGGPDGAPSDDRYTDSPSPPSDSPKPPAESPPPAEETPDEWVKPPDDMTERLNWYADAFLESIAAGDYEKAARDTSATDAEAYRFIQDMTVGGHEIAETRLLDEYTLYRKILFNVSESNNDYFHIGESYWDLIVSDPAVTGPVKLFRPSGDDDFKPEDHYTWMYYNREENEGYSFCVSFTQYCNIFVTATDFNAVFGSYISDELYEEYFGHDWKNIKIEGLVHNLIHFYMNTTTHDYTVMPTMSEVREYVKKTTGITDVDYTVSGKYGDDGVGYICSGHGGDWLYWSRAGREPGGDGEVKFTINYYADTAFWVVAKTITYTCTSLGDGSYIVHSTELVYDSGFKACKMGV